MARNTPGNNQRPASSAPRRTPRSNAGVPPSQYTDERSSSTPGRRSAANGANGATPLRTRRQQRRLTVDTEDEDVGTSEETDLTDITEVTAAWQSAKTPRGNTIFFPTIPRMIAVEHILYSQMVFRANNSPHGAGDEITLPNFAPGGFPSDENVRKAFVGHRNNANSRRKAIDCLKAAIRCGKLQLSDLHADIRESDIYPLLSACATDADATDALVPGDNGGAEGGGGAGIATVDLAGHFEDEGCGNINGRCDSETIVIEEVDGGNDAGGGGVGVGGTAVLVDGGIKGEVKHQLKSEAAADELETKYQLPVKGGGGAATDGPGAEGEDVVVDDRADADATSNGSGGDRGSPEALVTEADVQALLAANPKFLAAIAAALVTGDDGGAGLLGGAGGAAGSTNGGGGGDEIIVIEAPTPPTGGGGGAATDVNGGIPGDRGGELVPTTPSAARAEAPAHPDLSGSVPPVSAGGGGGTAIANVEVLAEGEGGAGNISDGSDPPAEFLTISEIKYLTLMSIAGEVKSLKERVAVLEKENEDLKGRVNVAEEDIDGLGADIDSTTFWFGHIRKHNPNMPPYPEMNPPDPPVA